jgi:hypothetical protein
MSTPNLKPTYAPDVRVESQPDLKLSPEPIPSYWKKPDAFVTSILFRALCIASFGRSTLQHTWHVIQLGNGEDWQTEKDILTGRMNNMNVVVCVIQVNSMSLLHATQLLPEGWVASGYHVRIFIYNAA